MGNRMIRYTVVPILLAAFVSPALAQWKVGVAKRDITPTEPVILTGYGSRTEPSDGIDSQLWARALAIGERQPHVVIAVDNCGVCADMVQRVYERVARSRDLPRNHFVICSTHTHNAPNLPEFAPGVWAERHTDAQWEAVLRYAQSLEDDLVALAEEVLSNQVDAALAWGQGKVTFGGNRRVLDSGTWKTFGFQHDGPVDHSLPLLVAKDAAGKILAIWTNYACHCTTVGAKNQVGGDWAGYANEEMEHMFDGAVALTTIGCGADVGPQPTGTLELARQHGRQLADEVQRLITTGSLQPVDERIESNTLTARLPYETVHDEAYWKERAALTGFDGVHGRHMLRQLQQEGSLDSHLSYDITTWQFGDRLAIVFLPGEVCVDYAVRLKMENDWQRLWINGWSNDVPCYIPSRRVLREEGYEPDFSMIYYCRPSRFDAAVEDEVVNGVNSLLGDRFKSRGQEKPDIFAHPGPTKISLSNIRRSIATLDARQQTIVDRMRTFAMEACDGFESVVSSGHEESTWYDFLGQTSPSRPVLRQTEVGSLLSWRTAVAEGDSPRAGDETTLVYCFSGGLGWQSQPQTAGFVLAVADKEMVSFDVTREASCWKSAGDGIELLYLPTWTSAEDSAGFFLLVIHDTSLAGNPVQPRTISVKSLGDSSQRWFSVDKNAAAAGLLRKLLSEAD